MNYDVIPEFDIHYAEVQNIDRKVLEIYCDEIQGIYYDVQEFEKPQEFGYEQSMDDFYHNSFQNLFISSL